ncbi:d07e33aa-434f-452a-a0da-53956f51f8b8-CDS [Sclerotinia trifoliorum]|uniref:Carboxylic ester hydrolase n=1 Tax=Sclerotinia trifoliorum TaxID=28548 RepID=A0A8H2ZQY4_9HELO|nr:d07e33aa-434f-452a-a0da-53956f51f8b8-CDS [Sclerotinia trifoliorum]
MKQYTPQLLCAAALAHSASAQLYNKVIHTSYGPVQGIPAFNSSPNGNISNWKDITVWKGIPYGADTSGENRWTAPKNATSWKTTFQANKMGPLCGPANPSTPGGTVSEDCLNLNIWTNGKSTNAKLPVVLWSFPAGGAADQPLFDGAGMASQGIVFVNYNYRISALGWLSTPELSEEMYKATGSNSSGNWGQLDQFHALKWVHANIAAFGGDPDHITVMGQSAGSAAVYHFVNSPLTKGLIVGAIAESGTRDPYDPEALTLAENYRNQSYALESGLKYMASKNVSTIAEMRALPLADLEEPVFGSTFSDNFGNVLDGYAIPAKYIETLATGPANDVPYITGNTRDESGAAASTNLTVAQYEAAIVSQYGPYNLSSTMLKLYPAVNSSQASMAYNAHWRDTSRISSWSFANRWSVKSKSPIWTYYWNHAPPGQTQGAYHESEINYVLNNLYGTDKPWEVIDYEIALKMNGYWANFAKTGNPNMGDSYKGDGTLPVWNVNSETDMLTLEVGDGFAGVPIGSVEQVKTITEYFSFQNPV